MGVLSSIVPLNLASGTMDMELGARRIYTATGTSPSSTGPVAVVPLVWAVATVSHIGLLAVPYTLQISTSRILCILCIVLVYLWMLPTTE